MSKFPTGIYHRGAVTYASPTSCVATLIAVVFALMFLVLKTNTLKEVDGLATYKQEIKSFNKTRIVPNFDIFEDGNAAFKSMSKAQFPLWYWT